MPKRSSLPRSAFALPSQRLYPLTSKARARAALAYAARPTTRGSYTTVRKAVLKKYPSLKQTGKPGQNPRSTGGKGSVTRSTQRGTSRPTTTLAPRTRQARNR
jgi:hypothetical protein